jgi:hypothetical protein
MISSQALRQQVNERFENAQRAFRIEFAKLAATNPVEAAALGEQFATAYLQVISDSSTERFFIPPDVRVFVGSDAYCQLRPIDPSSTLSRRHAVIEIRNGRALLEDLNSANGTWVNGTRIARGTKTLADGDVVRFGTIEMTLRMLDGVTDH